MIRILLQRIVTIELEKSAINIVCCPGDQSRFHLLKKVNQMFSVYEFYRRNAVANCLLLCRNKCNCTVGSTVKSIPSLVLTIFLIQTLENRLGIPTAVQNCMNENGILLHPIENCIR